MKPYLLIVLLATLALLAWTLQFFSPCASGCNVVLIMVDTLSGNHLATYGYGRDTMPETTAFFEKNGVIFDNATSNSTWTLPSFTGMYFSDIASDVTYKQLDDGSRPSLQSELYAHNVVVRATRPARELFIFDAITRLYKPEDVFPADEAHLPTAVGESLMQGLAASSSPFFLLVHTFEAHEPYAPEPPFNEYFQHLDGYAEVTAQDLVNVNWYGAPVTPEMLDAYRLRYDQQIAQTDRHVAEFIASIPPETLKHTIVILAADHGESFYEHGSLRHGENGLYQEELHIPLMMYVPGIAPRRVAEPVSLMDMSPTILSLMHIAVPQEFRGESLVPLLNGGTLGTRIIPLVTGIPAYLDLRAPAPLSLEAAGAAGTDWRIIPPDAIGVRRGAEKLFLFTNGKKKDEWQRLNLASDPAEKNNLAAGTAPLPLDLVREIGAWRSSSEPATNPIKN